MKRLAISVAALIAAVNLAQAADLPSAKAPEQPPGCFDSFLDWWNQSASKCPLTYMGITLYGTLDSGYGYYTSASRYGIFKSEGVNAAAHKVNLDYGAGAWSPNGLSTSTIGIKMKEKLVDDWYLIGAVESGINPDSGFILINGPKSIAVNNLTKTAYQTAGGDSSRAGQIDNGQGFLGFSNKTYGTVTVGRVNALSNDVFGAYDPVKSNNFTMLSSGSITGFGSTEAARVNTAVVYRLEYQNFRFAGMSQFGNGYYFGNGSMGEYQGQIGATFGNFDIDVVGGYAKDVVGLSSYSGSGLPAGVNPYDVLKATLSDNTGLLVGMRYKWKPLEFYAGYSYVRMANPSDLYPQGFQTIADGIYVPAGGVTTNAYNINKIVNLVWGGLKWDTPVKDLNFYTGLYYKAQNNYNTSPCTGSGIYTSSSKCSGSEFYYSFMATYKLFARVDLYGGLMVSNAYGGIASGYVSQQNINPTVGLRFRF